MARQFKKREYRTWTEAEIRELRKGKIPAGRTYSQCCAKNRALGLPMPPSPTGRRKWTKDEIEELKKGRIPKGRSLSACVARGYAKGLRVVDEGNGKIHVESVRKETRAHSAMMDRAGILTKMRDDGMRYTEIAALTGVSKQYVYSMVQKYRASSRYRAKRANKESKAIKMAEQFKSLSE